VERSPPLQSPSQVRPMNPVGEPLEPRLQPSTHLRALARGGADVFAGCRAEVEGR
jgi:hypothetical protein